VTWLLHAASMDTAPMGLDRSISPPGMSVTVRDILRALEDVRPGAAALVRPLADPAVADIVGGWPAAFAPDRGLALGFSPHEPLVDLVAAFVADDLDATRRERATAPA
jgi:hypothetical protein